MGGDRDTDDRVALRALVEAYAFAVDGRDCAKFVDLFSDDATLGVYDVSGAATGSYAGRGELDQLPRRLERYDRTMHLVHNHDVQLDGDEASGEVYCTAHHLSGAGPGASDRVLTIRYLDRYRREPDRWRIRTREVRVQWLEERTVDR
jgi:ketosteroid isomerase-like protein